MARWFAEARGLAVEPDEAPATGRSSALCCVRAGDDRFVVRPAPDPDRALFPDADLGHEAAAMAAAAAAGVPVPEFELVEDPSFAGRPFLVLPRIAGRHTGEVPSAAPWLAGASEAEQRALHESFLDVLAAIHGTPTTGLTLRRAGLAEEVAWWRDYAEWVGGGTALVELFDRCAGQLPTDPPDPPDPPVLLWGDVRLGNVVVAGDRFAVAAVLDWEMASIGPAELDVAWFTALSALTERFAGGRLPGFLDREQVVARYEEASGRRLRDLEWHEAFAVARSTAVLVRSEGPGVDVDAHPMVRFAARSWPLG